ncbi:MAG: hypothetical protein D6767_03060 [Candidatus Hydrogenedentota bacterium]|nr:MAG: hypothetical protein D6767_03060 [Candidatus Hydrogenedentota bacterium]
MKTSKTLMTIGLGIFIAMGCGNNPLFESMATVQVPLNTAQNYQQSANLSGNLVYPKIQKTIQDGYEYATNPESFQVAILKLEVIPGVNGSWLTLFEDEGYNANDPAASTTPRQEIVNTTVKLNTAVEALTQEYHAVRITYLNDWYADVDLTSDTAAPSNCQGNKYTNHGKAGYTPIPNSNRERIEKRKIWATDSAKEEATDAGLNTENVSKLTNPVVISTATKELILNFITDSMVQLRNNGSSCDGDIIAPEMTLETR